MNIRDLLGKWRLGSITLTTGFLATEVQPDTADRAAAWDLYVELVTRIATQPLGDDEGDEARALASVFELWGHLRAALKANPGCATFARLAIPFFNQRLRPFTARWHKRSLAGALEAGDGRTEFRAELGALQHELRHFAGMLAELAGVEAITDELLALP